MEHESGDRPGRPRIRHTSGRGFVAELDLDAQVVTVFETERSQESRHGRWVPLAPPLGPFRGRVVSDEIEDHTCSALEFLLGRGTRAWSFENGPWVDAERQAIAAGVGEYEARLLRKLMWSFYRSCWPLKFTDGCGFGAEGVGPLIAAAITDPQRMRARWELLLLTGGLCWEPEDGDLNEVPDDAWDNFYDEP